MKVNSILVVGIGMAATLLVSQPSKAQGLTEEDQKYITQVAAENAPKTNAKVITLHVKKVKAASSADTTDAEKKEKFAGLHLAFTMVVGESSGLTYQFKTDDTRVDKVQVGQDYTVVLGMAYLDMKKHKVNVKDRNSAVIFVPNGDKLVQFTLRIDAVEEK
ncbi:MAG TPA: hypothetical protein VGR55_00425 [Candidatus Acidoferrum sp.]|nr:hypothetical protein [Candidatus Acidoferrum sp.]